ncbi:MAG: Uma2 family endonuclease [Myxococcales bacterium]|nr:Uma2 family endonuclease [Myxococcales bacterium]
MSDLSDAPFTMDEVEATLNARLRPLSVDEYMTLVRQGAFDNERVELLRGRVVRMAPQGEEHAWTSGALTNLLVQHFGRWATVRPGAPVRAGDYSMPEPDFALVPHSSAPGPHPSKAFLLIEISKSSLREDRRIKAPLYAEEAVAPEYWIVNVVEGVLEVFRGPENGGWKEHFSLSSADVIRPVSFPDVEFPLTFLQPKKH